MKKVFLAILAMFFSLTVFSQIYFWKDGVVFRAYQKPQLDSITFNVSQQMEEVEGALNGVFTVSPIKKVKFSGGNVMYHPYNKEWTFASKQWIVQGTLNDNISVPDYNGYLDLFGWSTEATYFGVSTLEDPNDYWGDFVDWGSNFKTGWYTMTKEEWSYLLEKRPNAGNLWSCATVYGVKGMILLPDDFVLPEGKTFTPQTSSWNTNEYSQQDWRYMEAAGAVFLPAAYYRFGSETTTDDEYFFANYWMSSSEAPETADYIVFRPSNNAEVMLKDESRDVGQSVRLVYACGCEVDTVKPLITTSEKSADLGLNPLILEPEFSVFDNCDNGIKVKVTTEGVQGDGAEKSQTWVATATDASGNEAEPVTITYTWEEGEIENTYLPGDFSVSPAKKVQFASGNVVFQPSTKTWRFAPNQLTILGKCNKNVEIEDYKGWLDLFGWSTDSTYFGVSSSSSDSHYEGDFVDWAANFGPMWHTMSREEWEYLINERPNASSLYSIATVNGTTGLILLPDDFVCPTGIEFNDQSYDWDTNSYSLENWSKMESAGAVFLPCAGYRYEHEFRDDEYQSGRYWTSTPEGRLWFDDFYGLKVDGGDPYYGFSVRLVYCKACEDDTEKPVITTSAKSADLGLNPLIFEPEFKAYDDCDFAVEVMVTTKGVQVDGAEMSLTWVATATDASGNEAEPVTITYTWEEGEIENTYLPGHFSVSATKQVQFASGNTVCQPSTKKWRFAPNQWTTVGKYNDNVGNSSYTSWIDLFGWSTQGTYFGASSSNNSYNYEGNFVDWGENFGEGAYTLSADEWSYLLEERPNADSLYSIATVNGVKGTILLSDDFVCPLGLDFEAGAYYWSSNQYSGEDWTKMENAGAVFLPAASYRGDYAYIESEVGRYWTSTQEDSWTTYEVYFSYYDDRISVSHTYSNYGLSVRLVKAVE